MVPIRYRSHHFGCHVPYIGQMGVLRRSRAMTIGNSGGQPKPRSNTNRRLRHAGNSASVTMFAGALCLLFVLPLIYLFSTMLTDPSTSVTPDAPLYPALGRTYPCPSEALCSYHDGFVAQQVTWDTAPTMGPTLATVAS